MTLLEYIPFIDDKVVESIRDDFYGKFHFLIDREIRDKSPTTIDTLVIPADDFKIIKIEESQSQFEYEYWKKLSVIWYYSFDTSLDEKNSEIQFDFWAIGYINASLNYYSTEVIDPYKYHLKKVQDLKLKNLKQLEIPSLFEYKSEYITTNFIHKFLEVCRKTKPIKRFQDFNFANDLVHLSEDLCFILSELSLYKPYLYDFLSDPVSGEDRTIYRYFPSFYDKHYFHLASNYLQTIYNYWDRIGDLLYHFFEFPKIKSEKDVYFDRIINQFPNEYKNDEFEFLFGFYENEFKQFNKDRKQIVHYMGIESQVFSTWIDYNGSKKEIEKLQEWKMNLIEDYLELRKKSFRGIENALKLIENKNKRIQ